MLNFESKNLAVYGYQGKRLCLGVYSGWKIENTNGHTDLPGRSSSEKKKKKRKKEDVEDGGGISRWRLERSNQRTNAPIRHVAQDDAQRRKTIRDTRERSAS